MRIVLLLVIAMACSIALAEEASDIPCCLEACSEDPTEAAIWCCTQRACFPDMEACVDECGADLACEAECSLSLADCEQDCADRMQDAVQ